VHSGKIRELYALPDDQLLLLATDNVSAYDRVLPTPIPGKGAVLTQLTTWWLSQLGDVMPTHLVSTDVPADVAGRALVVEKLDMIGVECVVRGYLAGSGWKEYSESGTVAGLTLPEGLQRGERLERPIFTPAAKAPQGSHDENITFLQLVDLVGEQTALELRRASLRLYVRAERVAREHGLVLVDTKFEFGRRADGTLVLADEVLTPDSSRYWAADSYAPGTEMPSLDKQQLRDWITNDSGWSPDSGQPAPDLPDEVVSRLSQTYADTYEFAELLSRQLEAAHPGEVTTEWLKKKRSGVLVDHRQNGHGKTIASVYSVRPKPGAPVSTPLEWAELTEDVRPRDFTMDVALQRVAERGDLFAPVLAGSQQLGPALRELRG
jgi:phosphoribosylaminoimidazole-succinocarboxamide synthase